MIHKYKGRTPQVGQKVLMAAGSHIIGDVSLDDEVNLWFGAVLRGDVDSIKVGKGSNIQDNTTVHVSEGYPTLIGDYVTVGHNCIIHACQIGNLCLIGMGTTVLDGAVIGEGSVVGANSLVTKNKVFPPNSLIIGSPAKVIRPLTEGEIQGIKKSAAHYIELAAEYI